ncbi:MAG: hypothetical protein LBI57_01835 [Helicobacteraceae bacterium]|jgi:hypothetical protein|nr:hypothetical protein [Helicobacteraceae bacterium]
MISWIKNNFQIIIILICLLIACINVIIIYKNYQKDIVENYIKIDAKIILVGKSGNGIYTKALIIVTYNYENEIYQGTIKRTYKDNDYYKTGDTIIVNVNKNDPEDIK